MAVEDENQQSNGLENWWDKVFRSALALTVVALSGGCILTIAVMLLGSATEEDRRLVFSTLVPVFATWAGTVLAFYFSRENFNAASDAVNRVVNKLTPEQRLAQTAVRDVMKPRAAIRSPRLKEGEDETSLTIKNLLDFVDSGYSRVLVFGPGDIIRYVLHESTLTKYVAERLKTSSAAIPPTTPLDPLSDTLGTMLQNDEKKREVATRFVFVKEGATLADARAAMLAVKGCEDVFVTKSGKRDEPVLGWLTNTDITRDL